VVVSKYCTTEGLIYALRNHEYKYYRRLAAQLLGEREAIEALPQLCDALEDPEEVVQSGTAETLAKIGNTTIFERLMNNLESPRPRVRQYSAYVLGQAAKRLGSTGGFNVVETLENAAGDRNNLVRVEVIYALYELGYSSSADIFIAGLKDEEAGVRRHSANALGRAKGRAAELALAEAFADETDQDVRRSIATALSGFGSGAAIDTLLRSLPFESEPVRVDIAAKLAETGTPRAVRVLADLDTSDKSPRVRKNAAVGLLRAQDPSTPASEALIELADESIMDNLIDAMDDPNATVADNAARAIVRIHSLAAVPELIQMLDSANTGAVGRAIAVLEGLTYRPYGSNTQEWKTWYKENFETGD
jgi:HEAT repeat protein